MKKIIVVYIIFQSLLLFPQADASLIYKKDSLLIQLNLAKHDTDQAKIYYRIAKLYDEVNPKEGLTYLYKALKLSEGTKNLRILSDINNQIGYFYYFLSDYNKSVEYFLNTLKICEKQNNKPGIASCHNNIGSIYLELVDTVNALHHHLLALSIRKEINNNDEESENAIAMSYGNVGKTYFISENYTKAMEYFTLSLKISKEFGNKKREALMLNNIGSILAEQKKYDNALNYFTNALNIYKEIDSPENVALCLNNIAEIYFRKKDYTQSIADYEKSLNYALEIESLSDIKTSYEGLHNCYLATNDYKLAHEYLKKYMEIKDSIFNTENSSHMNELLAQFDSDKKEQEIKLLTSDKELQSVQLKNSRLIIIAAVFGLLLFGGFAAYAYYSFKQKQRINHELDLKNKKIEFAYKLIDEKQKEVMDSINYAKRIQYALLASADLLQNNLNEHFVLFNPKDIVSGDFYWATEYDNNFYLAVCDSTGHGVPGAFMSLLNIGFLSEAIKEKNIKQPHEIFNYVRKRLIDSINNENQKDGMDGILVRFDRSTKKITYASANNAPVLISNNQITILEKDRMPVGKGEKLDDFKLFEVNHQPGDVLYLYTDGYADQFGGPKGKKFKYKTLNELFIEYGNIPLNQQAQLLESNLIKWKGNLEQVDDVLVFGIKI
jgi:serine phosphatase RsbU (regulator of sigma subunit)